MPRRLLTLVMFTFLALSLAVTPALAATTNGAHATSGSPLPFTGLDFGLMAGGAALLLLLGVGVSRLTRTASGRVRQSQRRPRTHPVTHAVPRGDQAVAAAPAVNGAPARTGDAEAVGATVRLIDDLVEGHPGSSGHAAARGA